MTETSTRLAKLREPFPPDQIGKLPKGGVMLDFIGHGYVTARFLDADPEWSWEPMAYDQDGLPKFDEFGGLWMWLTIAGIRRIGYGDSGGKKGPNGIKEAIGDALRNAGMRFGAGLELWCKGNPDAPEPPSPKDVALADLRTFCDGAMLDLKAVGSRFAKDYGGPITEADAATIKAFTGVIREEQAAEQ